MYSWLLFDFSFECYLENSMQLVKNNEWFYVVDENCTFIKWYDSIIGELFIDFTVFSELSFDKNCWGDLCINIFYYIRCILPETIEILIILIFSGDLLFFNVRDENIFISKIIKLNSIFSFKLLIFCHLKIEIWVFYLDLFWSWTISFKLFTDNALKLFCTIFSFIFSQTFYIVVQTDSIVDHSFTILIIIFLQHKYNSADWEELLLFVYIAPRISFCS